MRSADALVVGGGVVGCAVAWSLAREGLRVALLERDGLAAQASGAAAGMLLPMDAVDPPGPLPDWGLRSLALFPEIAAELREGTGLDPEFEACGAFYVATDEPQVEALRARRGRLPGPPLEWLDPGALRDALPAVTGDARGALWSPGEAHVRSPLLVRALAAAAEQRGAQIVLGAPVTGLLRSGARVVGVRTPSEEWGAEHVVLCTGAWAPACSGWLGSDVALPIEPIRGQIVSLEAPRPTLPAMVVHESAYVVPKRDGSVVVGATQERTGFDCRVTAAGVAGLLAAGSRLLPPLADASFRSAWAGLRPGTPDGLPLIGPLPGVPGLLLAVGHHRNGVLLAPVTGRLIADRVCGKEPPADAAVFRPERFAERSRAGPSL